MLIEPLVVDNKEMAEMLVFKRTDHREWNELEIVYCGLVDMEMILQVIVLLRKRSGNVVEWGYQIKFGGVRLLGWTSMAEVREAEFNGTNNEEDVIRTVPKT